MKTIKNVFWEVLKKEIPEKFPELAFDSVFDIEAYSMRKEFIKYLGFVKIAKIWIRPLAKYLKGYKVLEIMSGNGSLSKALQDEGVNIIPTDNYSWDQKSWFRDPWTKIKKLDAIEAIEKYGKSVDYIICSWPPYDNPIAFDALIKMRQINPNCKMIYIGEGESGCTADDSFHNAIVTVKDIKFDKAVKHYQRWYGMNDYPQLVK